VPVAAQLDAQRLPIRVVQHLANGVDRHIDPPQRADHPGLPDLLALVAAIPARWVNDHRLEQAEFVVMAQRVDRQTAEHGERADTQQVVIAHPSRMQSWATRESMIQPWTVAGLPGELAKRIRWRGADGFTDDRRWIGLLHSDLQWSLAGGLVGLVASHVYPT